VVFLAVVLVLEAVFLVVVVLLVVALEVVFLVVVFLVANNFKALSNVMLSTVSPSGSPILVLLCLI
jgi:hypothetical protein